MGPVSAPTRISLAEMRADALHGLLLSPRGKVATVDQIAGLSDLSSWPSLQLQVAICDLCDDGRLAEDEHGNLIVHRTAS